MHNVFRLALQRSLFARLFYSILVQLLLSIQRWFVHKRPAWCLPPTVILKRAKPGWGDEFQLELDNYSRMRTLQGDLIPWCYGEVKCRQGQSRVRRAIILSDIGDEVLGGKNYSNLSAEQVYDMLLHLYKTIKSFGLYQEDEKPQNFHVFGGKIVAIDFEMVKPADSYEEGLEPSAEAACRSIMRQWQRDQAIILREEEENAEYKREAIERDKLLRPVPPMRTRPVGAQSLPTPVPAMPLHRRPLNPPGVTRL